MPIKWPTASLRQQAYRLRKKHGLTDEEITHAFIKAGKMVAPKQIPDLRVRATPAPKILPPPPADPALPAGPTADRITRAVVEQWILTNDPRANIGMKWLEKYDNFSDQVEPTTATPFDFLELITNVSQTLTSPAPHGPDADPAVAD